MHFQRSFHLDCFPVSILAMGETLHSRIRAPPSRLFATRRLVKIAKRAEEKVSLIFRRIVSLGIFLLVFLRPAPLYPSNELSLASFTPAGLKFEWEEKSPSRSLKGWNVLIIKSPDPGQEGVWERTTGGLCVLFIGFLSSSSPETPFVRPDIHLSSRY